jgi:hypothetical protein
MPRKARRSVLHHIEDGTVQKVLNSSDPGVLLLRGHGLVEAALATLLQGRLRVEPHELELDSNFERLARLALAGSRYAGLRKSVLALNAMRNKYAHELDADPEALLKSFVAQVPGIRADVRARQSVPELAAASMMMIIHTILQVSLEVARYRPDLRDVTDRESN